ncbi:MAG: DUF393 domain-containing protein [Candidatus Omnitrophica bacterium]|nr:DUF393 domain-containing protein [Candidatus Omnitrophota bacterium]
MSETTQRLIFFDGVCGLCNRFVDWVIRRDRKGIFMFTPIQGETAAGLIAPLPANTDEWSIIYRDAEGKFTRASDAVLTILSDLGGGWRMLGWFKVMPRDFRDFFYQFVAKRRYQWFKKRAQCRLPTAEERAKFLP